VKCFWKGEDPGVRMAKVHVLNVCVLDNPAKFATKFEFEITFECVEDLPEDLEWKIIYVGSAESEEFDQILDTVYVGPVPEGRHKFVFSADPPNPHKIPVTDVVGVTVILLTCSYRSQEFIRVGYYVCNEYTDPELQETPPEKPDFEKLQRNIVAENPRVTKFKINWEDPKKVAAEEAAKAAAAAAQAAASGSNGDVEMRLDQDPANQVQTEPGKGQDRPFGVSNVPPPRLPTAEEVENFPPDAKPVPRNPLPPFKDPMLQSPAKKGPPKLNPEPPFPHNTNSRNSDNLMDADFAS